MNRSNHFRFLVAVFFLGTSSVPTTLWSLATNARPRVLQRYEILVSPKQIRTTVKAPREITVLFPIDGHILPYSAARELATIRPAPGSQIKIEGHADATGYAWFNTRLSQLRAQTVAAVIKTTTATNQKIKIIWHGAERPAGDNRTPGGRAANRRVTVKFFEEE
jgi:outer membrane protein OmpA-like peptidoglycan-associated protein